MSAALKSRRVSQADVAEAIRAAARNPRLLDPWVRTHDVEGAIVELARRMHQ